LWCPDEGDDCTCYDVYRDHGFSEEFIALLHLAREQGCSYLFLDEAGPVQVGLPTFDW
jgi:hypothetical protein